MGLGPLRDEFPARGRFEFDRVEPDVGTVEARADHDRPVESEIPGDFRDLSFRRGRGERGDDGACGQLCDEFADAHVAWAEVVSPLEHAVRLVDGDEVHAGGLGESGEIVGEQALRRDVQDAQASPMGHVVDASASFRRHSAVDQGGGHSPCLQRLHLVAHERA